MGALFFSALGVAPVGIPFLLEGCGARALEGLYWFNLGMGTAEDFVVGLFSCRLSSRTPGEDLGGVGVVCVSEWLGEPY